MGKAKRCELLGVRNASGAKRDPAERKRALNLGKAGWKWQLRAAAQHIWSDAHKVIWEYGKSREVRSPDIKVELENRLGRCAGLNVVGTKTPPAVLTSWGRETRAERTIWPSQFGGFPRGYGWQKCKVNAELDAAFSAISRALQRKHVNYLAKEPAESRTCSLKAIGNESRSNNLLHLRVESASIVHRMRGETPNDAKLSDGGAWSSLCRWVARRWWFGAQAVMAECVRCRAWLGMAVCSVIALALVANK